MKPVSPKITKIACDRATRAALLNAQTAIESLEALLETDLIQDPEESGQLITASKEQIKRAGEEVTKIIKAVDTYRDSVVAKEEAATKLAKDKFQSAKLEMNSEDSAKLLE